MPFDQTAEILIQGGTAGLILGLLVAIWALATERVVPGKSARDREDRLLTLNESLGAKVTEQTDVVRSLVVTIEKQTSTIARLRSRPRS